MSLPFIAEIRIFTYAFPPHSWAYCDGQLLPISGHTALFSLIGCTYGGDCRSSFALPDMRGRAPMHAGTGPGLTTRREAQQTGSETVSLNSSQIPAHNHFVQGYQQVGDTKNPAGNFVGARGTGGSLYKENPTDGFGIMDSKAISTAGASSPHENMQPYLSLSFCIALSGIFPPAGS